MPALAMINFYKIYIAFIRALRYSRFEGLL